MIPEALLAFTFQKAQARDMIDQIELAAKKIVNTMFDGLMKVTETIDDLSALPSKGVYELCKVLGLESMPPLEAGVEKRNICDLMRDFTLDFFGGFDDLLEGPIKQLNKALTDAIEAFAGGAKIFNLKGQYGFRVKGDFASAGLLETSTESGNVRSLAAAVRQAQRQRESVRRAGVSPDMAAKFADAEKEAKEAADAAKKKTAEAAEARALKENVEVCVGFKAEVFKFEFDLPLESTCISLNGVDDIFRDGLQLCQKRSC